MAPNMMGATETEKGARSVMPKVIHLNETAEVEFYLDVPDEVIEAAAHLEGGKPVAATIAFCSGLDTCPG